MTTGKPVGISNVVISTQHTEEISHKEIEKFCIEKIIRKVLPKSMVNGTTQFLDQSNRTFRHRWTARRYRADRSQDHRR